MPGEYQGDFTRDTFDQRKHFLRVLTQQGRVSIDADWNEQTSILVHLQRTLARDVFGNHAASKATPDCFKVEVFSTSPQGALQQVSWDFRVGGGRYYVQGTLCEVEAPSVPVVPPPPVTPLPPANPRQVFVAAVTLDGRPFEPGEYVEVYDASTPVKTAIARIDQVQGHGALLLDSPIALNALPLHVRRLTTYLTQPDYRFDPVRLEATPAGRNTVVYLDVWERHITSVQDDAIREVALGTADTASRAKVVWQVKVTDLDAAVDPHNDYDGFVRALREQLDRDDPPGMLKARATPDAQSTDPCTVSPDARYRGVENQLYRVEVHRGGPADPKDPDKGATFKWSRENGCVVFPIGSGGGTRTLTLEHVGRDDRSALREGDWVEATDDASSLANRVGHLLRVEEVDRVAMTVRVSENAHVGAHAAAHPMLVRWDRDPDNTPPLGSDNAALIVEGSGTQNWLPLEDGVQIQFQEPLANHGAAHYRSGDYWLIPARTATGDVQWPVELDVQGRPLTGAGAVIPLAQEPHGIDHWYAPLALIAVSAQGVVSNVVDQRW